MKKIKIFYFSGTGNTYYIINRLAKQLISYGNIVDIVSCESNDTDVSEYDMVGIAFPIHTSKAPVTMERFLENIASNDIPLFGIVTSGYMAGDVLYHYHKKFIALGYKPFLYQNFVVGNNLHLPYLSPLKVLNEKIKPKRIIKLQKSIIYTANNIDQEIVSLKGKDIFSKVFGIIQRSVGKYHERVNFKGFHSDISCTKCMWCINNCPTKNIYIKEDTVTFKNDCIICMRCYNFCPVNSIQCTKHTENKNKYQRYSGIQSLKHKTDFN